MAGAGFIIIFVVAFVGCAIWSALYLIFASHYFITTVTESAAGIDEVPFPSESFLEWWWKPLLCVWVLSAWVIPMAILLSPIAAASPLAFAIVFVSAILFLYPLSMISVLYAQNWFMFMHPIILWRLVSHFGSFAYVHLVTLITCAVACGFLALAIRNSILYLIPACFVIPTAILLYARHWGRFAWLALNFEANAPSKKKKKPRKEAAVETEMSAPTQDAPEVEVEEVAVETEPLPLAAEPEPVAAMAPAVAMSVPAPAVQDEEEDEWSLNKKPYGVADDTPANETDEDGAYTTAAPDVDKPMSLASYYDEKAKKEKAKEKKKRDESRTLPPLSDKTPTFRAALLFGVWEFMIYPRTIQVWINLIVLTAVELFFVMMVVKFWPQVD